MHWYGDPATNAHPLEAKVRGDAVPSGQRSKFRATSEGDTQRDKSQPVCDHHEGGRGGPEAREN